MHLKLIQPQGHLTAAQHRAEQTDEGAGHPRPRTQVEVNSSVHVQPTLLTVRRAGQ